MSATFMLNQRASCAQVGMLAFGQRSGLPSRAGPAASPRAALPRAARALRSVSVRAHLADKVPSLEGRLTAQGLRFAIIVGRFNDLVTKPLLEGCVSALHKHGADVSKDADIVWVPGSFEIPLLAKSMAQSGKYDAVIAIGAVVRGSTTHYDEVCSAATSGILNAGLATGVPIIFGILTCETMEQALDRAGGKTGNKGYEAGVTAMEMANILKDLKAQGKAAWH